MIYYNFFVNLNFLIKQVVEKKAITPETVLNLKKKGNHRLVSIVEKLGIEKLNAQTLKSQNVLLANHLNMPQEIVQTKNQEIMAHLEKMPASIVVKKATQRLIVLIQEKINV